MLENNNWKVQTGKTNKEITKTTKAQEVKEKRKNGKSEIKERREENEKGKEGKRRERASWEDRLCSYINYTENLRSLPNVHFLKVSRIKTLIPKFCFEMFLHLTS